MLNKTVLGKFLIAEQTGEKDLFLTYNGKDTKTGLTVNVTAFKPNMVAAVDFLERFESLAKAITKIESPHTVPVLDYGEVEGQVVIVREGIEGQSLADLVTGGNGLQMDIALDIACQLGEYVEAIHQAGIFQGVFDPEEILLSSDSVVRVTNLGMAQGLNIGELLAEGKAKAQPYHAPELLRGEKADPRTDFYSLGALLFEILTGKELDTKAVSSNQSLIVDMLPSRQRLGIPPEWDELVAKCLHPVPAKRIQSAAEFLNRVTEVQRGMAEGAQATMIGMEDSLVGQTLGAYRLVERLGQGGMATVYKGYEAALDRYVAVKVLPQFFASDPNFTHRFRREAKAIAQLNHPNIIPIYSYGEQSGITYLVMQFVEGGTLKHERGQTHSPEEALRLLLPIARALGYAHGRGIVHRDIKPSNVLMAEGNWPMLADFGLAQMAESSMKLTGTGVGLGTPMYMSPEQGRGDQVDARTDIYSLGIMLYELVTGDVPFRADTPMAIVIKHMTAPMPMPRQLNPNIPAEVENIILKSTAKDLDDRYQTAGEMVTAMERVLNRLAAAIKEEEVVEDLRPTNIKPERLPPVKQPGVKKVPKTTLIVILGLLGLCFLGVILMGVFDICPPVGPWPQPPWCPGSPYKLPTFGGGSATSVPSLLVTEGTLGPILFQDDFEGQISSRWAFSSSPYSVPWEAIEMDGRTVMHSLPPNPPGDSSTAEIKPTSWENYAVQFDFRFLKPDQFGAYYFELMGQLTDCPPTIQSIQAYSAIISTDMVQLSKNLCRQEGRLQLSESDKDINLEVWHTLQYMFIGNRVQILIDGEKYVDFTDDDEPLTTGGDLWITSYGKSEILVDNLKVYEVIPSVPVASTETTLMNESGKARQEVLCLDESSYIEIPYSETLDLPEALTLEAWVQIAEFSNNCPYGFCGLSPVINQGQSFSAAGNYTLFLTPETLGFLFQPRDSKLFAPAKLKTGWNHVAVTHTFGRGDASRLYLNGESLKDLLWTDDAGQAIDGNDPYPFEKSPYYFGRLGNLESSFIGCLDEVRIWDHVRTQDEIQGAMSTELTGDEEGLAGYWKFSEEKGATVVADSSPNGNDGQIHGNAKLQGSDSPADGSVIQEYFDDFENGLTDLWNNNAYYTENLDGNQVSRGAGGLSVGGELAFSDYELELDLDFTEPSSEGYYGAAIQLRRGLCPLGSGNTQSPTYYLEIINTGVVLLKWHCDGSSDVLVRQQGEIAPGQWHHLRARLVGAHIEVYMDDYQVIDYVDENDPILQGAFGFSGHLNENITYFDNFSLKLLSRDASSTATTPTAGVTP